MNPHNQMARDALEGAYVLARLAHTQIQTQTVTGKPHTITALQRASRDALYSLAEAADVAADLND